MDKDSGMGEGDMDRFNPGKESKPYPSSSLSGFSPKEESGAES